MQSLHMALCLTATKAVESARFREYARITIDLKSTSPLEYSQYSCKQKATRTCPCERWIILYLYMPGECPTGPEIAQERNVKVFLFYLTVRVTNNPTNQRRYFCFLTVPG